MKLMVQICVTVAALFLATVGASAQQFYGGRLEITQDTGGNGACGGTRGDNWYVLYRLYDGTIPDSMSLVQEGANVVIKSLDQGGQMFTDGSKGKITGTINFSSANGALSVTVGTMVLATYTLAIDKTDANMWKITKMTAHFKIKETGVTCNFVWNGVATPAAFTPPG